MMISCFGLFQGYIASSTEKLPQKNKAVVISTQFKVEERVMWAKRREDRTALAVDQPLLPTTPAYLSLPSHHSEKAHLSLQGYGMDLPSYTL